MTIAEHKYFEWLCHFVYDDRFDTRYDKLLELLYGIDFVWTNNLDENRAIDGLDLRDEYGIMLNKGCSLLEMLIGFCLRVENQITQNTELGDRTGEWFWIMINNMMLGNQSDDNFDASYCINRANILMRRSFSPNGEGGLFVLKNPRKDLRQVDFWYHFMWYLSEQGGY